MKLFILVCLLVYTNAFRVGAPFPYGTGIQSSGQGMGTNRGIFHNVLSWFPKDNSVQGNSVNNISNYLVNNAASIPGDKVNENGGNEFHDGFDRFEMKEKDTEKPESFLPSREAVQAVKDSLLNLLGKLKDSETSDNSSYIRIYY